MDYNEWFGGLGEVWQRGEYPPPGCGLVPCTGDAAGVTASDSEQRSEGCR